MLKKSLLILILAFQVTFSQKTISGEINTTTENYNWIALYQLKGAKQLFIESVFFENGEFKFNLPEDTPTGMYRLVFKMDGNSEIDIIYNKENIVLNFNPENPFDSLNVISSEENKQYVNYLQTTNSLKQKIDSLQYSYFYLNTVEEKKASENLYQRKLKEFTNIQNRFEINSEEMLAYHFIKANNKYYPDSIITTPQEYLNSEKEHYFDYIDFTDVALLNSTFITESVLNYVLYLNVSDDVEVQTILYKNAINEVIHKVNSNFVLKSEIITTLLYVFAQKMDIEIIDFLLEDYYYKLPAEYQNSEDIQSILDMIKFAVGKKVPDFTWEENATIKSLYSLQNAKIYLLVFWSTTCSHCIEQIPELYSYTKDKTSTQVVAIALEDNSENFNSYAKKFTNWINILGLKKWQNPIAESYQIVGTPTYFILDTNKKIIAKPESIEDIQAFYRLHNKNEK